MAKLRGIETELAKIGEPGMSDIAQALGVDEQEVAALRRHIGAPELPIDSPSRASNGACLADILAGNDRPDVTAEEHELASLVRSVVSDVERDLDARDRQILRARWFGSDTVTLQEIGARFGVTRERARQLERRVLDRLRAAMDERGVTRLAA